MDVDIMDHIHPFQVCIQMLLDNYVAAAISVRDLTCRLTCRLTCLPLLAL
jgi:hypothetical protein